MLNKKTKSIIFLSCFVLSNNLYSKAVCPYQNREAEQPKLERHFVFDTIPLNLEEITQSADRIFAGKCISITEIEDDPESKLPVIEYKFKIDESFKGLKGKDEITFKQWKPTTRESNYDVGKSYVLFLFPNSERGLTSPVGFLQGQFEIESSGFIRKNKVVKNKAGNKGLYKNLKSNKEASLKKNKFVKDYISRCSELGIPIRYKEFTSAVKELAEQ